MIPDEHLLTVDQVLKKLKQAIEKKKPFSLVRVGDGENIILAQNSVMTMPEVMEEKWARNANKDRDDKGVTLPNITLRDQMVDAIKKASIVGIPFYKNDPILTEDRLKRPLTDRVFKHFDMTPKMCCHTFVNRVFAQRSDFWKALQGKRILIITKDKWSDKVTQTLRKKPYNLNVTMSTTFHHHDQMEDALKFIEENKDNYDIALISCGVNALILAQKVAETGNIGIDFGKSLMYIVQKKAGLNHFSRGANKGLIP